MVTSGVSIVAGVTVVASEVAMVAGVTVVTGGVTTVAGATVVAGGVTMAAGVTISLGSSPNNGSCIGTHSACGAVSALLESPPAAGVPTL